MNKVQFKLKTEDGSIQRTIETIGGYADALWPLNVDMNACYYQWEILKWRYAPEGGKYEPWSTRYCGI